MPIKCFKLQLLRTVQAVHRGIYIGVSVVQSLEVVTSLGNSTLLGQQAGTPLLTMTCVPFSQKAAPPCEGMYLYFLCCERMFTPKKCLPLAYVSIWPCQAEIPQTHVEPLSLLESVCLSAMTSTSQSAQTLINKLKDFITICQWWCHCLLEQETLRLISWESSTIMI